MLGVSILVGLTYTVFNILTLSIIFIDKKLRLTTFNYPIASFLVASTIQGSLPCPLYIYKILKELYGGNRGKNISWLCDVYRFLYFFCAHITKISFLIISFERLVAVKFPYWYESRATKKIMINLIAVLWVGIILIDAIPFMNPRNVLSSSIATNYTLHNYNNTLQHFSLIISNRTITTQFFNGTEAERKCAYNVGHLWGITVLMCFNGVPFLIIILNYSLIWRTAYKFAVEDQLRADSLKTSYSREKEILYNSKRQRLVKLRIILELKASKTALATFSVYAICWLPMGSYYMADHFCKNCFSKDREDDITRRAVKLLAFSSSLIVPLVYCWCSKEFRKAVIRIKRRNYRRRISKYAGKNLNEESRV